MKKTYTRPRLVEYGRLADLTRGSGGPRLDILTPAVDDVGCNNGIGTGCRVGAS